MITRRQLTLAILLAIAMPLWPAATVRAKGDDSLSARLFMLEPQYGRTLLFLTDKTMSNAGGIPLGDVSTSPFVTPRDIVPSPGGTRIAVVTYGRTPIYAKYITIRVFDGSGVQLARFHPQVPITVRAISDDGKWIEGGRIWPQTNGSQTRPPTLYLLDGKHGRVLSTLTLPGYSDAGLLDIGAGRLYTADEAQPFVLTAYDLMASKQLSRLSLDGVVAPWTGPKQMNGLPVVHMSGVATALSPDGKEIAIYNGETDRLTLVDAPSMKVISTRSVSRPQSWLERIGGLLGLVPTAAEAKEVVVGMMLSMQFSADGRSLYVMGDKSSLDATGHQTWTNISLERIDVTSGQLIAQQSLGGMPIWWIGLAADSSAVYVLTPVERADHDYTYQDGHYALRRLDPTTLQMTNERTLDSVNPPQLYILG